MIQLVNLLLFAVATYGFYIDEKSSDTRKEKIVGGLVASIEEASYLAQIIQNKIQICGASIISEKWILTAAHCMADTEKLVVMTGSSYKGAGEKHSLRKIIIHKDYNSETFDNDIALIELADKINFNQQQKSITLTAKLPEINDQMKIFGFGRIGEGKFSSRQMKSATVRVISNEECARKYTRPEDTVTDNMFCAGTGETDSCEGDSGGPAVIDGQLSGIISSGKECASEEYPGVYTQIFKYRRWIASKTQLSF